MRASSFGADTTSRSSRQRVDGEPGREVVEGVEIVRDGSRLGVYRAARRFWSREGRGSFDVVIDEINTRPFLAPRWIDDTPVVALIHQLAREIWFYETPFPVSYLGRYILEPWWLRTYRRVPALTVSQSSADSLAAPARLARHQRHPRGLDAARHPSGPEGTAPDGRLPRPPRCDEASRARDRRSPPAPGEPPDARLWVIGNGPLEVAAEEGVTFLGRLERADLLARLARAHVLVATSIREGWGLNVSEAAACGTPTIGYAVPGLVDSIPASGGALVDPTPEALADGLQKFFANELRLEPKQSTLPWPDVAIAVERRIRDVGVS